jgi:uncharacterized protein (DUF58 family)
VGGGAERLSLARRLGIDGLGLEPGPADETGTRRPPRRSARRGRVALNRIASLIDRPSAPGPAASLPDIEALPRHAQIVLVGDFLSPLEAIRSTVAGFAAAGLHGHLLQVLDPAEETLPFDGRVRFEGIEERDEVMIGRVETVRDAYVERLAAHRQGLAAIVRPAGWSFATHRTDRPPPTALLALYTALARLPGN